MLLAYNPVEIRLIQNLNEAKDIWTKLSPKESIFDTWEFRMATYAPTSDPLLFYTAYEENQPVAVLPLQRTISKGYLEFFGGSMNEDNRVFCKPGYENLIPQLYKHVQEKAVLEYITGDEAHNHDLEFLDYKYSLSLKSFKSVDDYIAAAFNGETKKKFVKRLRKLEQDSIITVEYNKWEDLDLLFNFNIERFGEDSTFHFPSRKEVYAILAKSSFDPFLMTFSVNGEKQAVAFALTYKSKFYSINTSISSKADPCMSSYARVKKIEEAIQQGAISYEAQAADCGWKESWHFEKVPLYKFHSKY